MRTVRLKRSGGRVHVVAGWPVGHPEELLFDDQGKPVPAVIIGGSRALPLSEVEPPRTVRGAVYQGFAKEFDVPGVGPVSELVCDRQGGDSASLLALLDAGQTGIIPEPDRVLRWEPVAGRLSRVHLQRIHTDTGRPRVEWSLGDGRVATDLCGGGLCESMIADVRAGGVVALVDAPARVRTEDGWVTIGDAAGVSVPDPAPPKVVGLFASPAGGRAAAEFIPAEEWGTRQYRRWAEMFLPSHARERVQEDLRDFQFGA